MRPDADITTTTQPGFPARSAPQHMQTDPLGSDSTCLAARNVDFARADAGNSDDATNSRPSARFRCRRAL